jgi:Toprim domain
MLDGDTNRPTTYSTTRTRAQGHNTTNSLAAIADHCGRAEGNDNKGWKCNCPICGRHSLSVAHGYKLSILVKCWHCEASGINDGYTQQRDYLIERGLLSPNNRDAQRFDKEKYDKWNAARRAEAVRTWDQPFIKPLTGTDCASAYLRARGLEAFIHHPALRCTSFQLLARVWHVRYGISAIQWTWPEWRWVDPGKSQKCCVTGKAKDRETRGVLKGGAVWLGAPQSNEEFIVAEGLESCLSAMVLMDIECGAAVLGPNLKGLVLPASARRIHIAADSDETGRGAAECTARLWRSQGLRVRVSVPDKEGEDFNDVLKRERGL